MGEAERVVFHSILGPDGRRCLWRRAVPGPWEPWPKHLAVTRDLIGWWDTEFVTAGDGMLRFRMQDGDAALYGLAHEQPRGNAWITPYSPVDHYDLIRARAVPEESSVWGTWRFHWLELGPTGKSVL